MKFSEKRSCVKASLIRFNFIKMPIKYILNLAAILRRKVLQVSLRRRSEVLKAAETIINFTSLSMQMNYSHIISFKVKRSDRGSEEVKMFPVLIQIVEAAL